MNYKSQYRLSKQVRCKVVFLVKGCMVKYRGHILCTYQVILYVKLGYLVPTMTCFTLLRFNIKKGFVLYCLFISSFKNVFFIVFYHQWIFWNTRSHCKFKYSVHDVFVIILIIVIWFVFFEELSLEVQLYTSTTNKV